MSNIVIVPVVLADKTINFIITGHKYFPDSDSVEIVSGYMAEPDEDFYKRLKNKYIRKIVKRAIAAEYATV